MANNDTTLVSIYGCKVSTKGDKLVITLVNGTDDSKKYYTACVKLDNSQKTHAKVDKDYALIKVPLLKSASKNDSNKKPLDF